jgi:hypothetical protein
MNEMLDLVAEHGVDLGNDADTLWVNVDGICRLRVRVPATQIFSNVSNPGQRREPDAEKTSEG